MQASLGKHGRLIVAALLVLQAVLAWLSLGQFDRTSVFCTGPSSSGVATAFGGLHLLFVGVALLGVVSLRVSRLRVLYAVLLLFGVAVLPLQAQLVSKAVLRGDGP